MSLRWKDTVEKKCPCCGGTYVVSVDKTQLVLDIMEEDRKKRVGCGGIDMEELRESHSEVGYEGEDGG